MPLTLAQKIELYGTVAKYALLQNRGVVLAVIVTFGLLLRSARSKTKFISDYSKVGRKTEKKLGQDNYAFDEYDVIVVGGGELITTNGQNNLS